MKFVTVEVEGPGNVTRKLTKPGEKRMRDARDVLLALDATAGADATAKVDHLAGELESILRRYGSNGES
jgi:hypothetical protein